MAAGDTWAVSQGQAPPRPSCRSLMEASATEGHGPVDPCPGAEWAPCISPCHPPLESCGAPVPVAPPAQRRWAVGVMCALQVSQTVPQGSRTPEDAGTSLGVGWGAVGAQGRFWVSSGLRAGAKCMGSRNNGAPSEGGKWRHPGSE